MIQIKRGNLPRVLTGSPQSGTHYNKPSVVKALWEMQHGKCCYCEQKMPEEGHGKAVEHFRPKSGLGFEGMTNHWPNLLLACPQCNGKKSDKFPVDTRGKALMIDPSDPNTDPEDHIDFVVDDGDVEFGLAFAKNNSLAGGTTIDVIRLSGSHHVRERKELHRLLYLSLKLLLLEAKNRDGEEQFVKERGEFARLLSAEGKFAGFARAYARTKKRQLKALGLRIPKGTELADAAICRTTSGATG